ncbi:MAG: PaaI family thioesterase [Pseudomonadota bacterium]
MAFAFSPEMAPPTARWMGMEVQDLDTDAMTCTATFRTRPEMQNFGGVVQGGIIATMMDDAMGFLTFLSLKGEYSMGTTDLHTQFLRAVPMGANIRVEAEVTKAGKVIAFTQATLYANDDDEPAARATATQRLRAFKGMQFEPGKKEG